MSTSIDKVSKRWPAPAKINLFLHVTGRRDDGYHLLQTHFQFLDYADSIDFRVTKDGVITRLNDLEGVAAKDDLVVRAAQALKTYAGSDYGVAIKVDKMIPAGGGLGGGSSDAATTLVALNELWSLHLEISELAKIGLSLGADVPIFVYGHAAWAEGVGEQLTPLEAPEGPVLVVHPGCQVATAAVFSHPQLTRNTPAFKIHQLSETATRNDCEAVTRQLYPPVGEVLDWLGAHCETRMSGTGACVFGLFESNAAALSVAEGLPESWTWFVAARTNVSPLHERLAALKR